MTVLKHIFAWISLTVLMSACGPMMAPGGQLATSSSGSSGQPVSSSSPDSTKTTPSGSDSASDAPSVPSTPAAIPPTSDTSGGGSTPEMMIRHIGGDGAPATTGPVASAGGIVSAPSSPAWIETSGRNIRAIVFPPSFHDRCQGPDCVKRLALAGDLSADLLGAVQVIYRDLKINYDATGGTVTLYVEGDDPGFAEADVPQVLSNSLSLQVNNSGYVLLYVRKKGVPDMLGDAPALTVSSAPELLALLEDTRVDYVGDLLFTPPAAPSYIHLVPGLLPLQPFIIH